MITVVTLASRGVGFLRWLAQGRFLGTGGIGDVFNSANMLPNILFEVAAGGALAGAVIPLLSGPIARRAGAETSRIASALLGWTLVVLIPLAALVALLAEPVAGTLGLSDPAMVDVAAGFLRVFAVQIPLYGLAVVLGGILQAHRRFFWPAFAPLVSSLVVIASYAVFGALADGNQADVAALSAQALNWLAWGTTAGVAALALPLVLPVRGTGVRLRPTLRFPGGEGRRAARLASAGIGALIAQQLSVYVVMRVANSAADGTFTIYLYAQQVYLLPYAVLAFPLATSAFPRLAEHASAGRTRELAALVASTTRTLLVVVGVGVSALVAAAPAVEAAFGSIVHSGDAAGMASALAWMAPGLLGFALVLHLSRALYAVDRGRAAVVATASGWLVVSVAVVVLPWATGASARQDVLGLLGVATALGMSVAGVLLLLAVRRAIGADATRGTARTSGVLAGGIALGSLVGALLCAVLLPEDASLVVAVVVGVLVAAVAGIVTLAVAFLADRGALDVLLRRGPPGVEASGEGGDGLQGDAQRRDGPDGTTAP